MIIFLGLIICISFLIVSIIKMFQMQNEFFEIKKEIRLQILEKTKKR